MKPGLSRGASTPLATGLRLRMMRSPSWLRDLPHRRRHLPQRLLPPPRQPPEKRAIPCSTFPLVRPPGRAKRAHWRFHSRRGRWSKARNHQGARALLAAAGVTGALADPSLQLVDSTGQILATNDDWMAGTQAQEIIATTLAPSDPKESAIIASLEPALTQQP